MTYEETLAKVKAELLAAIEANRVKYNGNDVAQRACDVQAKALEEAR